jgi:hypothetical protein
MGPDREFSMFTHHYPPWVDRHDRVLGFVVGRECRSGCAPVDIFPAVAFFFLVVLFCSCRSISTFSSFGRTHTQEKEHASQEPSP